MEAPPSWANPQQAQVVVQQQQQQPPSLPVVTTAQQHETELFSKYSTLDEPVMETILRDVRAVTTKLSLILSQRPFHTSTQSVDSSTSTTSSNSISSLYYNALTPVYNYSVVSTNDSTNTTTTNNHRREGSLVVYNPAANTNAIMTEPEYVDVSHFERAWRAHGTDDDIIFIAKQ